MAKRQPDHHRDGERTPDETEILYPEVPEIEWTFQYSGKAPEGFVLRIEGAVDRTVRRLWREATAEAIEAFDRERSGQGPGTKADG